jgi:hypothetical protein
VNCDARPVTWRTKLKQPRKRDALSDSPALCAVLVSSGRANNSPHNGLRSLAFVVVASREARAFGPQACLADHCRTTAFAVRVRCRGAGECFGDLGLAAYARADKPIC